MFLKEFIVNAKQILSPVYEENEVKAILREWLSSRTNQSFATFSLEKEFKISDELNDQLNLDLQLLVAGKPLQYILGFACFHNLKINVNESVLIPRPETEELVQLILEEEDFTSAKILDICTGSGCIALALKNKLADTHVFGADVSFDALSTARENGNNLHLYIEWSWCDVLQNNWGNLAEEKFDLIVSNPPYIMLSESGAMHKNVLNHEPHLALFVEDDDPLVFYRQIIAYSNSHLKKDGQLWFEINPTQADNISRLMQVMQFTDVYIYKDLSGKDRFVRGKLS